MFTKSKTDWSLLAKYLAGEANEKEKAAVEKWLGPKRGKPCGIWKIKIRMEDNGKYETI